MKIQKALHSSSSVLVILSAFSSISLLIHEFVLLQKVLLKFNIQYISFYYCNLSFEAHFFTLPSVHHHSSFRQPVKFSIMHNFCRVWIPPDVCMFPADKKVFSCCLENSAYLLYYTRMKDNLHKSQSPCWRLWCAQLRRKFEAPEM